MDRFTVLSHVCIHTQKLYHVFFISASFDLQILNLDIFLLKKFEVLEQKWREDGENSFFVGGDTAIDDKLNEFRIKLIDLEPKEV